LTKKGIDRINSLVSYPSLKSKDKIIEFVSQPSLKNKKDKDIIMEHTFEQADSVNPNEALPNSLE